MNKKLPIIIFALLNLIITIAGIAYVYSVGGPSEIPRKSFLNQFGKSLGVFGFFALALVYSRTVLKLIISKGNLQKRLEPFNVDYFQIKTFLGRILFWLNKTHGYLGVLAISFIFLHCFFTNSLMDNVLLIAILFLMLFEGITGIILEIQIFSSNIKRRSYLLHSQFFVGILILFLAIFGHALL